MAVPVKADLDAQLANLSARLRGSASRQMDFRRQSLRALVRALPSLDQLLALPRRRFDEVAAGLGRGLERTTIAKRRTFERASSGLRFELLTNRLALQRQALSDRLLRADRCVERQILSEKGRIARIDASLKSLPARLETHLQRERQNLVSLMRHADTAVSHTLSRSRSALLGQDRVLQSLSYKNVLKRGYAVVRDDADRPLTRASNIAEGSAISIEFADGRVAAVAGAGGGDMPDPVQTAPATIPPKRKAPKPDATSGPPKQGSLF